MPLVCAFRWEFKTEAYDIAFGLFYDVIDKKNSKKREQLIKVERVDSHYVPEDGTYTCTRPGFCELAGLSRRGVDMAEGCGRADGRTKVR